jgi:hypothetical protein
MLAVSEVSRLFRNREDRATVDAPLGRGVDVLSAREEINTEDADGRVLHGRRAERRGELASYDDQDFTCAGAGGFAAERAGRMSRARADRA